ncbi:MAG: phosphoribosylanthranilate isomerase [Acidimicrobiales bacterium]
MFVKICGITDVDDALLAVALGADALGFVFAPSTRQIAAQRARDIATRVPAETLTVGVFRDEAKERVVDIAHTANLRAVQLHGRESPDDVQWVAQRIPVVIKAVAAGTEHARNADRFGLSTILVDNPRPGSGELFDWSLVEAMPIGMRIILAGGLDPDNVADAIAKVKPWGVDVSSGVEREAGRKDPTALRLFIQNAKAAGAALAAAEPERGEDAMYNWEVE